MDNILQELDFLDLDNSTDDERRLLRSIILGQENVADQSSSTSPGEERRAADSEAYNHVVYQDKGEVQAYANVEHIAVPASAGYTVQGQMHSMYPVNMCMTNTMPPQYQPIMSYPVPMMSGPHLIGSAPGYYITSPGHPQPSPYVQQHPMSVAMNHPQYYNQKRKNNVRAKYSPRKEVSNGHDGYSNYIFPQDGYIRGPSFTGDMVQAATGLPIVMHPQQPVASFMQPHAVHVSPAHNAPIYSPVTFIQQSEVHALEEVVTSAPVVEVETTPVVVAVIPETATAVEPVSVAAQVELPVVNMVEECIPAEKPSPVPQQAVIPGKEEAVSPEASGPKSWASLFKKDVPIAVLPDKPTARVEPFTSSVEEATVQQVSAAAVSQRPQVDKKTKRLAEHLTGYELLATPLPLLPRGLINKSNWCYINATLQALIACPSFVHLVKSLTPFCNGKTEESSTPIIDSVVDFIEQFEVVPVRVGKPPNKKEEPHFGTSFEPSSIYKMLSKIRSETFKVEGRQEDAEEFLSCLLNGLHDEMIEIMKSVKDVAESQSQPAENKQTTGSEDEDWQVIGPKNKGCVTHTTTYSQTPVSNLFLGLMRSALHYAGAQSTATLQPFFSLQLDIQSEKVNSVRDALACLVSKEPLTGYVCSKTGQEVEASRQSTIENLPEILILHLKCFVYDKSGGCQKLLKRIDFTSDLELSKDFLSPGQKSKLKDRQRKYKLFAVVYHDGKEATKGHYVTEVHHTGTGNWLRFDDSIIRVVDTQLFKYNLPRMPYLLLYRKDCKEIIGRKGNV